MRFAWRLVATVPWWMALACSDDGIRDPSPSLEDSGASEDARSPQDDLDGGSSPDADAQSPIFDGADERVECAVSPCATQLVAGETHVCALMSDKTVQCWGQNIYGVLGRGDEPDAGPSAGDPMAAVFAPARVVDLSGVTHIATRGSTSCARIDDGSVRCWGANTSGQLGLAVEPPTVDAVCCRADCLRSSSPG